MDSRIIFIRHGITEGNKKRWFYGGIDIPLLPEGEEELKRMAAEGIYPELPEDAQFFTSELTRTKQTLRLIYGRQKAKELPLLDEMRFGVFERTCYDDMKDDPEFAKWVYDEVGDEVPEGGESRNQFRDRVGRGLQELVGLHQLKEWSHRHGGQAAVTVVVCHGGVIGNIMGRLFENENRTMWDWIPDPGLGYEVHFSGKMDGVAVSYKKIEE